MAEPILRDSHADPASLRRLELSRPLRRRLELLARAGYPKIVGKIFPEEMLSEVEKFRDEYRVSKKGR